MKNIKTLKDFNFNNKKVLVRVDINVPVANGKIVDNSRIVRIIPTIKYLVKQNAKIILLSHFGRPKGKFSPDMSLAPLVDAISELLPQKYKVKFSVDATGSLAQKAVSELKSQEVLLLENLRFHQEEEKNDKKFAKNLASLGDIYINDTFSCSHRAHSSIDAITHFLPCGIGLLFEEEISNLEHFLTTPKKPFLAIVGGSKISTKLGLLQKLIKKADTIIIGGGMANNFLKAQGHNIGKSLCEDNFVDVAKKVLKDAIDYNCNIILPDDVVVSEQLIDAQKITIVSNDNVPDDKMILDLGPDSCFKIINEIKKHQTIIWNGPVGAFEYKPFNIATETIARSIANLTQEKKIISIAGGGDVVASLNAAKLQDSFSYLSTAGGAFLEWLEGKKIPGLKALKK